MEVTETTSPVRPIPTKTFNAKSNVQVMKVEVADEGTVLLRTCAVEVINPKNGRSTLVYAQHDTASQATLISDTLKEELALDVLPDPFITVHTLSDQTTNCLGRTDITIKSLVNNEEEFKISGALVVPKFSDDESTLPHAVDTCKLNHFKGVKVPVLDNRKCIDILIGQSDRTLLSVLSEQEGSSPNEPSLVFTRLGPIASGGRVPGSSNTVRTLRAQTNSAISDCKVCDNLQKELATVKKSL